MKQDFIKVYQFKITLDDIKPSIWRRIKQDTHMILVTTGSIQLN